MITRTTRPWAGACALAVMAAALTACSPESAAPEIDPGWTAHSQGPVRFHAPPEWVELEATDESLSVGEDGDAVVRPGVFVTLLEDPEQGAEAEARSLVAREEATHSAQEAHQVTVDVPGTETAVEVTMWTTLPVEGGPRDVRWRWLIADLPDGRQVAVGAAGPRETFEELPLDEVFATVEIDS